MTELLSHKSKRKEEIKKSQKSMTKRITFRIQYDNVEK